MEVTIPCACANAGHDTDTVWLRELIAPRDALAISKDIEVLRSMDPDATAGDVLAVLSEGYIVRGVESWTLLGEDGKPLEVTKAAVRERLLSRLDIASTLADVADELYAEAVMLPLLRRASPSSPPTPTEDSTSAPTDSGSTPRKPSKPSSISTTRTGGTAKTSASPDGDSSFSPSSASAA
jgi:hypothetical protein